MEQKTILVVDDMSENLTMLTEILKPFYWVKAAPNGRIALKIAASQPDLILLDVMMPVMDGYQVCQMLKTNEETQAIPVIFISSNNLQFEIDKGMALGATNYLFKPIEPQKVLNAVKQVIG